VRSTGLVRANWNRSLPAGTWRTNSPPSVSIRSGSRLEFGEHEPEASSNTFGSTHSDRGRPTNKAVILTHQLLNRVLVALQAWAINRVDSTQQSRVAIVERLVADPQDLSEAGDDLGLGVDRGGGRGSRGRGGGRRGRERPCRLVVAAGYQGREHGSHHQQRGRGRRDPGGAVGGAAGRGGGGSCWSWNCMVSLVARAGW
jgi:hypothetical protein